MNELSSTFREELAADMRDALIRVFAAMLLIYGTFLAVNISKLSEWQATGIDGRPVLAMDCAMPVLLLAILVWLWKSRARSLRAIHAVCAAFVAVAMVNALASAVILDSPREVFYVGFFIIGVGSFLLDRAVVWATVAVGAAATMAVSIVDFSQDDILWAATCMVASSLFAVIIHQARLRMLRGIDRLRRADRTHREELAAAATRAESALAERIRAEAERAELEQQLRQSQRLDALGTLAGGVAHDMNNALAAITTVAATAIEDQPEGSSTRTDFEHILAASERGSALTRDLLGFARRGKRRSGPFDVRTAARGVYDLLCRTVPKRIRFELEATDETCVVNGDADQLRHALMNLALNAVDSIGGKGLITVRTHRRTLAAGDHHRLDAGDYCCVEISDTGGGMDADTLERAFEPFFSTTGNTGLGLSMVYGAVADHGGTIELDSAVGRGTAVTVLLPRIAAPATATKTPRVGALAALAPILVVDDEPLVAKGVARALGKMGLEAVVVGGGQAALDRLRAPDARFAAVVLDLAMPGMSGAETLEHIRAIAPELPVLLASGYPKDQDVEALLTRGRVSFLAKPYRPAALSAALEALLDVDHAITSQAG